MGVRFECPRGHKLHVKAHLSGQRGICPECGARFVVPSFSGGRVADASEGGSGSSGVGFAPVALESSASFAVSPNAGGSAPLPGGAGLPGEAAEWFVRPAAGGQYGPVDTTAFRQWIDEGRVSTDSWVWRTGWPEWKTGGEAIKAAFDRPRVTSTKPAPPTAAPVPATTSAPHAPRTPTAMPNVAPRPILTNSTNAVESFERMPSSMHGREKTPRPASSSTPVPSFTLEEDELDGLFEAPRNGEAVFLPKPTEGMRAQQLRRRRINQWLTLGLAALALVLLAVAVIVLNRNDGAAASDPSTPATLR